MRITFLRCFYSLCKIVFWDQAMIEPSYMARMASSEPRSALLFSEPSRAVPHVSYGPLQSPNPVSAAAWPAHTPFSSVKKSPHHEVVIQGVYSRLVCVQSPQLAPRTGSDALAYRHRESIWSVVVVQTPCENMPTSLITQHQRMFKASPLTLQTATLDFSSCKPLFRLVENK